MSKIDQTALWEAGIRAIDNNVEAMRDNLRDLGMEDGERMEEIVMVERAGMQEELSRIIEGDFSTPYEMPDFHEFVEQADSISDVSDSADSLSDAEIADICADISGEL